MIAYHVNQDELEDAFNGMVTSLFEQVLVWSVRWVQVCRDARAEGDMSNESTYLACLFVAPAILGTSDSAVFRLVKLVGMPNVSRAFHSPNSKVLAQIWSDVLMKHVIMHTVWKY